MVSSLDHSDGSADRTCPTLGRWMRALVVHTGCSARRGGRLACRTEVSLAVGRCCVSCGERGGAGMSGWSVQATVREPEEGKRQPRCGDICCKRAADHPRGTPRMLGAAGRPWCQGGAGGHGSPGNLLGRFGTMPVPVTNLLSSADRFFCK